MKIFLLLKAVIYQFLSATDFANIWLNYVFSPITPPPTLDCASLIEDRYG